MSENKKKFNWESVLMFIVFIIMGFFLGFLVGHLFDKHPDEQVPFSTSFLEIMLTLVSFYLAAFLQIIIHEGGHLIAGLMSGYKFLSFRIGSFMIIKNNDHFEFKSFSLAGTGGQCLMSPPDMKDGKFPNKFYNLGGVIANFLSVPVALIFSYISGDNTILSEFFFLLALGGLFYAIVNGLPIKSNTINTDGYNALELNKDKEALFSLWVQLKMNEQIIKGVSLKDMPSEWFKLPPKEKMNNSLISCRAVFYENRLMEEHKFKDALKVIDDLLDNDNIVGVYRELLKCDKIYIELVENDVVSVDKLYDANLQTFMKSMKNFPTVIRTEYTYNLLYKKDVDMANKIMEKFEKCSKRYPYPTDIESERELMDIATKKSQD